MCYNYERYRREEENKMMEAMRQPLPEGFENNPFTYDMWQRDMNDASGRWPGEGLVAYLDRLKIQRHRMYLPTYPKDTHPFTHERLDEE